MQWGGESHFRRSILTWRVCSDSTSSGPLRIRSGDVPKHTTRRNPGSDWRQLPEWSSSWSKGLSHSVYTKFWPRRWLWQCIRFVDKNGPHPVPITSDETCTGKMALFVAAQLRSVQSDNSTGKNRNAIGTNPGMNEHDSQSDPHPEARASQRQTTQNFGTNDRYDSTTLVNVYNKVKLRRQWKLTESFWSFWWRNTVRTTLIEELWIDILGRSSSSFNSRHSRRLETTIFFSGNAFVGW